MKKKNLEINIDRIYTHEEEKATIIKYLKNHSTACWVKSILRWQFQWQEKKHAKK
jgi:hypothetical protein